MLQWANKDKVIPILISLVNQIHPQIMVNRHKYIQLKLINQMQL